MCQKLQRDFQPRQLASSEPRKFQIHRVAQAFTFLIRGQTASECATEATAFRVLMQMLVAMAAREYITRECVYRSLYWSESSPNRFDSTQPSAGEPRCHAASSLRQLSSKVQTTGSTAANAAFQANFPSDYVSCHFILSCDLSASSSSSLKIPLRFSCENAGLARKDDSLVKEVKKGGKRKCQENVSLA